MLSSASGHKSHQNLPTDCPDEPDLFEVCSMFTLAIVDGMNEFMR
jgi:hypothetical protein